MFASLDHCTQTFENVTADARISEEAEHDVALAVKAGREAWGRYVAATGGEPDPDVRDRTPAAFFGA
ncbi:hypothetical protein CCAX7_000710 [Capsulimonas corticalis]|uniref:Uncharacterized protein n=1 Tax=Capsulimonas corticalis TaxID=2219043 RepID=A0A402CRF2_9BACT|nr:hypothetical protein [Capsulimonas corticalis]BDI28020.1 hypothetical protein CCAX7_000710 [Capsulimonas corticalis]